MGVRDHQVRWPAAARTPASRPGLAQIDVTAGEECPRASCTALMSKVPRYAAEAKRCRSWWSVYPPARPAAGAAAALRHEVGSGVPVLAVAPPDHRAGAAGSHPEDGRGGVTDGHDAALPALAAAHGEVAVGEVDVAPVERGVRRRRRCRRSGGGAAGPAGRGRTRAGRVSGDAGRGRGDLAGHPLPGRGPRAEPVPDEEEVGGGCAAEGHAVVDDELRRARAGAGARAPWRVLHDPARARCGRRAPRGARRPPAIA